MIVAARATGARQEELAGACHLHLDRKAKRLTVLGKRNKLRVIDLEPFGGSAIFDSRGDRQCSPILARQGRASRFALFTNELAAKDPDFVRFRFHDLRHLHAVEWLRSGGSIYTLQHRPGARQHQDDRSEIPHAGRAAACERAGTWHKFRHRGPADRSSKCLILKEKGRKFRLYFRGLANRRLQPRLRTSSICPRLAAQASGCTRVCAEAGLNLANRAQLSPAHYRQIPQAARQVTLQ
jgi:hypothetical protein